MLSWTTISCGVPSNILPPESEYSPSVFSRTTVTSKEPGRAEVYVLVEAAPDGEQEAPQRDVVGDGRPPDRAEVDGVEAGQGLQAVLRHHPAVLQVVLAAPRELREAQFERGISLSRGLEHPHTGAHDLGPDPIPTDDGGPNHASSLRPASPWFLPPAVFPFGLPCRRGRLLLLFLRLLSLF